MKCLKKVGANKHLFAFMFGTKKEKNTKRENKNKTETIWHEREKTKDINLSNMSNVRIQGRLIWLLQIYGK